MCWSFFSTFSTSFLLLLLLFVTYFQHCSEWWKMLKSKWQIFRSFRHPIYQIVTCDYPIKTYGFHLNFDIRYINPNMFQQLFVMINCINRKYLSSTLKLNKWLHLHNGLYQMEMIFICGYIWLSISVVRKEVENDSTLGLFIYLLILSIYDRIVLTVPNYTHNSV